MANQLKVSDQAESLRLFYQDSGNSLLHPVVEKFLDSPVCKRLLVACSGGADSVFMLFQLWAKAKDLGIQLIVAHYNHRWRGEDADHDAMFVEKLSLQLNCPFFTEARPNDEPIKTETDARFLRMRFLRSMAQAQHCQCIAFGHQMDDILETQLQRLGRGSGTDGLAAPRPVHFFENYPTHIRPVLHLRAREIREVLQKNSIVWREDESNKDVEIPRNALRHSVIPDMQDALEHDVSKGAARSRMLLEEDAVALDQLARKTFSEAFKGSESLKLAALRDAPRALARRALIGWLSMHRLSGSLSAVAFDQLMDAVCAGEKQVRLSAGAFLIKIDGATLRIESSDSLDVLLKPCSVKAGDSVTLSTDDVLETSIVPVDETLREQLSKGTVNVMHEAYIALISEPIFQIRARRPGDSFRPLGAPGTRKLKDWFIDRQIPVKERNRLPLVITDSGVIAWVPGLPPADDLKINTVTKMALKLTYKTRKNTLAL